MGSIHRVPLGSGHKRRKVAHRMLAANVARTKRVPVLVAVTHIHTGIAITIALWLRFGFRFRFRFV
jgi:hypothetical protein